MPKVSDSSSYPAITGSQLANNDRFYVVDVGSPNVGKGIIVDELAQAPQFSSRYAPVNGAWTAWTPTITAGSGTLTTASASSCSYLKTGTLFFARGIVTITTAGTGAGTVDVTMPSGITWPSGAAFWVGGWFENTTATSGQILTNNVGFFALLKDDGTSAINDNRSFRFHIFGQVSA